MCEEREMEQLVNLLGLSVPFAAAVPVYSLFSFLDRKASKGAKEAIAGRFEKRERR